MIFNVKKIILLAVLFFMVTVAYSQTTVDIVKEINKSTYESLTAPEGELKLNYTDERKKAYDDFKNDVNSFIDDFNLSDKVDNYKKSRQDSKEVIDLKNKITLLELKVSDLQYGIDRRDEALEDKDEEIINLKLKYRVASKILYFMANYNYSINELNDFFTDEELKIAKDIANEWKRLYK